MCTENPTPRWKELYIAAILEVDSISMSSRIREAKMAICDRVEELNGGGNSAERTALNRAMKALHALEDVYAREPRNGQRQPLEIPNLRSNNIRSQNAA